MAKKEFIRLLKGLDDEDLVKVIGECKRLKLRSQIKYLRLILIKYLLLLVVAAYVILAVYSLFYLLFLQKFLMAIGSIGMLASAHLFGTMYTRWCFWLKNGYFPQWQNVEKKNTGQSSC